MANSTDEAGGEVLRLDFDRRLMVQFHGSAMTSYTGLLPYRELPANRILQDKIRYLLKAPGRATAARGAPVVGV
jgi:hypothetical protein